MNCSPFLKEEKLWKKLEVYILYIYEETGKTLCHNTDGFTKLQPRDLLFTHLTSAPHRCHLRAPYHGIYFADRINRFHICIGKIILPEQVVQACGFCAVMGAISQILAKHMCREARVLLFPVLPHGD